MAGVLPTASLLSADRIPCYGGTLRLYCHNDPASLELFDNAGAVMPASSELSFPNCSSSRGARSGGRCRCRSTAVRSLMRHLEARGFQDFAKIAKEFPGYVVGVPISGRYANTTIQVSVIQVSENSGL